jgi:hypothetical protein
LSALAGLALLGAMGVLGVALLRRATGSLDSLELIAFGVPLGIVAGSLVMLAAASVAGTLRGALILGVGVVAVGLAVALWRRREAGGVHEPSASDPWGRAAVIVIALLLLRWAVFWRSALDVGPDGLWAGSVNIWGDWSQHLGDVTAFAYGDNFPPTHPRLAGASFAYHYLTSLTVAAMVRLGLDPVRALPLHSCVLSLFVALSVVAFARRLTGRTAAAALVLVLFVLGGGLGWWFQLADSAGAQEGWRALLRAPWDGGLEASHNLQWKSMFFALIAPQRALLYGLPLGLLSLTLLYSGVTSGRGRDFMMAGVVAGLLPFAHLGTLLALALVTPLLCLLFPLRQWALFFGAWAAMAMPQVWVQQDGPGAMGAMRIELGWLAAPDPWLWFWLKNLGLFVPLSLVALAYRDVLAPRARRFLAGFMPVFVIANVVVFQPWAWDNTKVLAYWFLATCILVGALLSAAWAKAGALVRATIVGALATMVLSGVLESFNQLLGRDRHLMLTAEEVSLADSVRARIPPRAVLAVGLRHNHPVTLLTGRRVLLGFPGWMWSQGLDYGDRERALSAMFALSPEAPRLFRRYGVDYVVIGPEERERSTADLAAYHARFPRLLRTQSYEIFTVCGGAPCHAEAAAPAGRKP